LGNGVRFRGTFVPESDPTAFNSSQISQIVDMLWQISPLDCAREYRFKNRGMEIMPHEDALSLRAIMRCEDTPFDLLSKLLVYNPDNRVSAAEAFRHPYFDERPIYVMNIA
jgi:serine/threonine protein kinase